MRELVREILEQAGYRVIEAPDGKAGMRAFRDHRPNLVITDLFMPEQEGIQTIRELRAEAPDTKILAISGGGTFGFSNVLAGLEHLGADGTLRKPFHRRELLSTIDQAFGG